jgi:predicted ATP-dependent serine protease
VPIEEFNRVLGGGIVPGSLILLGGDPGIGKSTLALQLALVLKDLKILYTSGEESLQQIKLRAERLNIENNNCLFLSETSLELLIAHTEQIQPDILIIDSIQTVSTETIESSPGSVSQVRECTSAILKYAKKNGVAVILIGHITKEGSLAGPKVLEHMVDVVLQFEGDTNYMYRILRSNKNRFGSTNELGIFEMESDGLHEILNPSEQLISKVKPPCQRHINCIHHRRSAALFNRNSGAGKYSSLRNTATFFNWFRSAKVEHAFGSTRKTGRVQTDSERCIPEYCRWIENQRSCHRFGSYLFHTFIEYRRYD